MRTLWGHMGAWRSCKKTGSTARGGAGGMQCGRVLFVDVNVAKQWSTNARVLLCKRETETKQKLEQDAECAGGSKWKANPQLLCAMLSKPYPSHTHVGGIHKPKDYQQNLRDSNNVR